MKAILLTLYYQVLKISGSVLGIYNFLIKKFIKPPRMFILLMKH
ncbi:hypothetical protein [Bacillus sp. MUM 116]|nr:hypothetical protein [Bacillus sp. MUM 116]